MLSPKELKKQPEYWIEVMQNDIFRMLHAYLEKENINQTQLAERMGVSKGYISQILNGNFNFSLSKLVEFSVFMGMYPKLEFMPIEPGKTNIRSISKRNSKSKRTIQNSKIKARQKVKN